MVNCVLGRGCLLSATFINAQAARLQFTNPEDVFRQCLGLVNDGKLYSIEDIQHEQVSGTIINWMLVCNANEMK